MWRIFKHDTDMWYLVSHFVTSKIALLWHSSVSYDVNVGHRSLIMHLVPKKEKKKTILVSFWKSKATKETKNHCVFTKLNSPVIVAEWVIFWRQKSRIKQQFHSNFIPICFWNNWSRHLMCLSQCVIGYCSSLKSFHQRGRRWWGEGRARF